MEHMISHSEQGAYVKLAGQFSFSDTQKFREILKIITDTSNKPKTLILNFSEVSFIDSAGMGMLLLLRDECSNNGVSLLLQSIYGQVEKIFHISKFEQLFSITK